MKSAFEAARAYLDKLPPAVSGAGGHAATFKAAAWCCRFGLAAGEAMTLLRDYSRRCSPPWTEKDLLHKLADARRVAGGSSRCLPMPAPIRVTWKRTGPRKFAVALKVEPAPPAETAATPPAPEAETLPHYTPRGELVVPFASPARFRYWQKRYESDGILTLAEVRQALKP